MDKIADLSSVFRNQTDFLIEYYQKLFQKIEHYTHLNFFTEIYKKDVFQKIQDPYFLQAKRNKPLFGIPFFLKDSFMVKNKKTAAGTSILENFYPNFNSTVYQLLVDNGAILLGKTVMDELSMGGTGLEAKEGIVHNFLDFSRIVGGSSSGSAVAVATSTALFALANDTGDSARIPATYLGIVGFKPTFGLISRYGLIPFSPSLDTVGFFTNNVDNLEIIAQVLFQFDEKDFTSQKSDVLLPSNDLELKKVRLMVIGLNSQFVNPVLIQSFQKKIIQPLKEMGLEIEIHSLPNLITENLTFLYQIISFSEALSSQAHLTGVNFGTNHQDTEMSFNFFDLIRANRAHFGSELKRRYVLGTFFTDEKNQDQMYFKAMKIRTYLNNYFHNLFQRCDFIIHIASSDVAPTIAEIRNFKKNRIHKPSVDDLLLIANFLGVPSLVLPFTKIQNLPVGINIFSQFNQDWKLISFAKIVEKMIKNESE